MTAQDRKGLEGAKDGKLRIKIADEKSLASARELVAAAELAAAATVNGPDEHDVAVKS